MSKDFQQEVFSLIKEMTGETNIMATPKIFLRLAGDLETGTFLAQLVYLSDKGKREDGFIYKTIDEWKQELFMSEYSVRKAKKSLEDMGLIETKVMKADGNPTVHYRVNKEALVESILRIQSLETSISQKPNSENEVSITKTTTETTTYIPHIPPKGNEERKESQSELMERFEVFYKAYPRHKSRGDAEKAWKSIKPDNALLAKIMEALEIAKQNPDWQKENHKYAPYPASWLRAKGWEDEVIPDNKNDSPNTPKDTWKGVRRL